LTELEGRRCQKTFALGLCVVRLGLYGQWLSLVSPCLFVTIRKVGDTDFYSLAFLCSDMRIASHGRQCLPHSVKVLPNSTIVKK